jgi:hypothetical protein
MWGDRNISPTTKYNYYMFGKETNNFYEVTKKGTSKLIERITSAEQLY